MGRDWKSEVPELFTTGDDHPEPINVGGLIDELKKLPPDLPISAGIGPGVTMVVFNISEGFPYLEFLDPDF